MIQEFQTLLREVLCLIPTPENKSINNTNEASDIVCHLPPLTYYSSLCNHVTEFGTRDGHSTRAILAGCKGKVISYDIDRRPIVDKLQSVELPCEWLFKQESTTDTVIEETDMIFFDTLHTYSHLRDELLLHGDKCRKFFAFHDTVTCGEKDSSGPNPNQEGIRRAIDEYVNAHGLILVYKSDYNNGFEVYKKVNDFEAQIQPINISTNITREEIFKLEGYEGFPECDKVNDSFIDGATEGYRKFQEAVAAKPEDEIEVAKETSKSPFAHNINYSD